MSDIKCPLLLSHSDLWALADDVMCIKHICLHDDPHVYDAVKADSNPTFININLLYLLLQLLVKNTL